MKKIIFSAAIASLLICTNGALAAFISGSTGADGAFNPTANTVVTLPLDGVLNYTTINVPASITVTFQKNAANTPVYMLATGDVMVNGTINVNGTNGTSIVGQGGPGGFNGGSGGTMYDPGGKGLGPGGGFPGTFNGGCTQYYQNNNGGGGASFGTAGLAVCGAAGGTYGNARLLPIVGGSGGGGQGGPTSSIQSGGGGGGAILIASSGIINLNGTITANGGTANAIGGGGSGGGVKLIANIISGSGSITAIGGAGSSYWYNNSAGAGRIRLETSSNNNNITTNPVYSFGNPGSVFVSAQPSLVIATIAGTAPPATTTGSYNQPDIMLPNTTTNPVTINFSATNIPISTTVKVWVIPQYGAASSANASLSGTQQASTGSANVTLSTSYSNIITAEATFTVVAMYYNGEEIDKVRVVATMGGKSETIYITKSGKEIRG